MIERHSYSTREEWLAFRDPPDRPADVTASVISALFGLHPRETALGLYAKRTGVDMPDADNKSKRRGRLLEPGVALAVGEERPLWQIAKANEYLRDPAIRLGATPDFYVRDELGRRIVLEAKTVAPDKFKKYWTDEAPPIWIALQNATQVMLDDADRGVIAALIVDGWHFDLHFYDVPRNARAEAQIRDAVTQFWANFDCGLPPAVDYARDARLLALMHPREIAGKVIDLRGDNRVPELLAEREHVMSTIKSMDARKSAIEAELRDKIGDAEIALVNDWNVKLKEVVVKEHLRRESRSRRFFITPHKD